MRTEIVIPFTFDTTPIEAMLQEQGKQEVMRVIEKRVDDAVIETLPKKSSGYGYKPKEKQEPDWRSFLENSFVRWLDEHSQEIVDEAALLLAARAGRKKAWREVLAEVKEESNA